MAFTGVTSGLAATRDALPKLTLGLLVSGNFFSVMGVEPELGRAFRPEEDRVPGRDAVVILSHSLWEQQFGSDPSILGRRVHLSGIEFTVVGVAPERFTGMNQFVRSDFYAPLMMWPRLLDDPKARPLEDRKFRDVTVKGRLKSGVSMAHAQTELSVIAKDLGATYPDTNRESRVRRPHRAADENRAVAARLDADCHADDARCGGAVRRLRQRRRPADQPGAGSRARDGDARGDRRRARPIDPSVDDGESADCARRRRAGSCGRLRCASSCFNRFSSRPICR